MFFFVQYSELFALRLLPTHKSKLYHFYQKQYVLSEQAKTDLNRVAHKALSYTADYLYFQKF